VYLVIITNPVITYPYIWIGFDINSYLENCITKDDTTIQVFRHKDMKNLLRWSKKNQKRIIKHHVSSNQLQQI